MNNIYARVEELLKQGQNVVLTRIVKVQGSAPRSPGAACLVTEKGIMYGSVGGGLLEYLAEQEAYDVLRKGVSCLKKVRLAGSDLSESEMLCGGEVDLFLEPIYPDNLEARQVFRAAVEVVQQAKRAKMYTRVEEGIDGLSGSSRALFLEDGVQFGSIPGLEHKSNQWPFEGRHGLIESQGLPKIFAEPVETEATLFLFGAGHVSRFVCPVAKMVSFRVVVIDDRSKFANIEYFPQADQILVQDFEEVFNRLDLSGNSYVAILTRGHSSDLTVLRRAIQYETAYIGMISSKRKRRFIYQKLAEEGVPQNKLDEIHSPIGLDIKAKTPEEIGVSIVGELIRVRAERTDS